MTGDKAFTAGRVHVRMPTYRRPQLLGRALHSLVTQTWEDWICDVFDDDPDQSGRDVCDRIADPRIRYRPNPQQKFASKNIDSCFSKENPYKAEFFFVLEDDNYVLDTFVSENIALCRIFAVNVVVRNQVVDYDQTGLGRETSSFGILEATYREGRQSAESVRLGALAGIGLSNGGLFWSADALSDFEIGVPCNSSLQEYLRTLAVIDAAYIALTPLAAWAANGDQTNRNLGDRAGFWKRELDLKRSIQKVRRRIWAMTSSERREDILAGRALAAAPEVIADNLARALILDARVLSPAPARRALLLLRALVVALVGRTSSPVQGFIDVPR